MPITINVEDGTGVADANSYVSVADVRTYATNRGVALLAADGTAATDDDVAAMLIKATDYLETRGQQYAGKPATAVQALSWPRQWATQICTSTQIPKALIKAECELVLVLNEGVDLFPVTTTAMITVDKTDVLETHYSDKFGPQTSPTLPVISNLLKGLFVGLGGGNIRVIRA